MIRYQKRKKEKKDNQREPKRESKPIQSTHYQPHHYHPSSRTTSSWSSTNWFPKHLCWGWLCERWSHFEQQVWSKINLVSLLRKISHRHLGFEASISVSHVIRISSLTIYLWNRKGGRYRILKPIYRTKGQSNSRSSCSWLWSCRQCDFRDGMWKPNSRDFGVSKDECFSSHQNKSMVSIFLYFLHLRNNPHYSKYCHSGSHWLSLVIFDLWHAPPSPALQERWCHTFQYRKCHHMHPSYFHELMWSSFWFSKKSVWVRYSGVSPSFYGTTH